MDIRKVIAWNLRRLRVQQDVAQEALAVDAEVDRTYVSKLERGLENPTAIVLERLASALNADICELFRRPKPGERPPKPLKGGRRPRT